MSSDYNTLLQFSDSIFIFNSSIGISFTIKYFDCSSFYILPNYHS